MLTSDDQLARVAEMCAYVIHQRDLAEKFGRVAICSTASADHVVVFVFRLSKSRVAENLGLLCYIFLLPFHTFNTFFRKM